MSATKLPDDHMDAIKMHTNGEGVATRKWDGTNVKVDGGELFKRQLPPRSPDPPRKTRNGHRFINGECSVCRLKESAYDANGYPWCEFTYKAEPPRSDANPGSWCSQRCGYCGRCN